MKHIEVTIKQIKFHISLTLEIFSDKTWPVTCDFIPLNVFDKPHDPCTDLPTVAPPQEVIDISELID